MSLNNSLICYFLSFAIILNAHAHQKHSPEVLEWSTVKINNKLPLLCKKSDLISLLGKPDKILDPKNLDVCASYFDKDFTYLVWGNSQFESTNTQAVISSIDLESGRISLVSPKITLDKSVTFEKIKKLFPKAATEAEELIITNKSKVLSIKLATTHKNSDDGWLLFFKAGKLVQVDYWIAC